MGFLQGKRALIVGLASNRSIAYGIASAMHREGAQLAFTYQGERLQERVTKMAGEFDSKLVFPCDVADDLQINAVMDDLKKTWDRFDILVHSVAYAPADQIQGDYVENLTREGFRIAHDISSYSLGALAKAAFPLMKDHPSAIVTLSYLGAHRAISNYNVMGIAKASLEANVRYLANSLGPHKIRVNAISAGPIRTLAAAGIKGFKDILSYNEKVTPMRQNVSADDVGNVAAFLCSDLAQGVTGDLIYVDGGYHIVGIGGID